MKMILIFIVYVAALPLCQNLENIRINYQKAVNNKQLCKEMMHELDRDGLTEIEMAYLGAFKAIWAKHAVNPFSKLSHFNDGKANIEKAVALSPQNTEIRLIRLSIQKNAPSLLGYNGNIAEDTEYIMANSKTIQSPTLRQMMEKLLNAK